MISAPRGIDGLKPREPIGAAIAMGRKGPTGAPVDKHRFFIVRPSADGSGRDARRTEHPGFASFNELAVPTPRGCDEATKAKARAHDEPRSTLQGILVHSRPEDAYTFNRQADRLKGHEHPRLAPSCMGNGVDAMRWIPAANAYGSMPCPGEKCPFAMHDPGQRPACHPHVFLLFQLRSQKLPNILVKYNSNGWGSTAGIDGFFDSIKRQAREFGVENPSVYGIPFTLTLSRKSDPSRGTAWVEVSMAADFPPGLTLQEYLLRQADARAELAGKMQLLQLGTAVTVAEVSDEETLADNARSLRPGSVPAVFDHPVVP